MTRTQKPAVAPLVKHLNIPTPKTDKGATDEGTELRKLIRQMERNMSKYPAIRTLAIQVRTGDQHPLYHEIMLNSKAEPGGGMADLGKCPLLSAQVARANACAAATRALGCRSRDSPEHLRRRLCVALSALHQ